MRTLQRTLTLCGFLLLSLPADLRGQQVYEGSQQGFPPFGSFHGSDFDTVSLQNGSLHIEIPILSVRQRGRTFTYRFAYDPGGLEIYWEPNPNAGRTGPRGWWWVESQAAISGWRLINTGGSMGVNYENVAKSCPGYGSYIVQTNYRVEEPDGTQHPLAIQKSFGPAACDVTQLTGPTTDGSGMTVDITTSPTKLTLKDGTQFSSTTRDTNGNLWSSTSDMLGRTLITAAAGPQVQYTTPTGQTTYGPQYSTWSYKDSSGNTQTYRFDYTAIDYQTAACGSPYAPGICYEDGGVVLRPSKLTLPNGKFYQFSWAAGFADLIQVDLPTGGNIQYTYWTRYYRPPGSTSTSTSTARRAVTSRTVNPGGYIWRYGTPGPTNHDGSVQDPLGNDEVHTFAYFTNGVYTSGSQYETQVKFYQGPSATGTLLRTVTKDYLYENSPVNGHPDANVRVIRQTTTLETGQASKVETDFETFTTTYGGTNFTATRLNPIERREYDYGATTPLRRTTYSYLHTGNSAYLTRNIVDRVTTTSVYDGAGALKAQSVNEWDNYTQPIQSTNAVQHDSAFGATFTTRGNMTAAKRWRNTDGLWLTARFQYDDVGNIVSSTDPGNHTTTTDYSDSWGNTSCAPTSGSGRAYPKSITNALGHLISFAYYSCTGFMASASDPNLQTATFTYDLMNRPDVTNFPDGGQVNLDYDDTALWVRSKTLRATGSYVVAYSRYDALGRIIREEACEDGSDTCSTGIKTDTTYDALGRKLTVTNPYRGTTDSTYGVTTFEYDALSRPTKTIPPDGSTSSNNITTLYSGNAVTLTDQAGKKRKSAADAMGRLIQVFEPDASGSFIYETDHQYDVLGNLTRTDQKGNDLNSANWRTRTFAYNSLSQVTSESNPEMGTITYQYDSEGKLSQKTVARNITTTFSYDVLHRVLQKTYSDTTPAANFTYDASSVDGLTILYPLGRMVKAWNSNARTVNSYDQMGKIKTEWQCTPINCGTGWFQLDYSYDLAGGVTSYTNGAGTTFTQGLNPLEQVTQIASSWVDAQHPATMASGISYHATGAISSLTYGNALVETQAFNNRLQPTQIAFGTALTLNYGFVDPNGKNNGNLMSLSASGAQSFSRSYTYDELNRLKTMTGATGTCNGLTWNYDIWANRKDQTVTGGSCLESHQTINSLNRVVDTGYGYDFSGNLTAEPGGRTYQYDAENQMISANGGALGTYVYDANGRRVRKTASGATTEYIYDLAGNVIAEKQGTTLTKAYVYLDGKLVAQYSNSTTYFVHEDHLGSTRLVSRLDRSTEECEDYYPYGELVPCGNTSTLTHKFTGKERDPETGLDDFDVRYFGSSFGRFLSPDPTFGRPGRPQTLNRYAYVLNNPLRFIDPTGLLPQETSGTAYSPTGSCEKERGGNQAGPTQCAIATPPTRENQTSNDKMQKANDPSQQNQQPPQQDQTKPSAVVVGAAVGAVGGAVVGAVVGVASGAAVGTAVEPGGGTVVVGIIGGAQGAQAGAETGAVIGAAAGALAPVVYTKTKEATKAVAKLINTALDHLGKLNGPDQNPNPRRGWRDTVRKSADNISKQADKIANKHLANAARFTADLLRGLVD